MPVMLRKMLRDMGRHKTQFVSIFLMAFLAMFIYAGVGGEWRGLQKSADDFYSETNLADAWVYGSGFTDNNVKAVRAVDGITQAERRLEISASADIPNNPTMTLYFAETGKISKPYIVKGAAFDKADADGVWIDRRFADANNITPGDELTFTASDITFSKVVRGLIYSSENVYETGNDSLTPDFSKYGYAYLASAAFPVPEMLAYSTLLIKTDGKANLETEISSALNGNYNVYLEQYDHPSVSMFRNEVQQHKMLGDIFPIVFLLIALLTIMTTMTRIVNNQRIQIGTLKALGFKSGVILRHYVSYGFFLALLGAAIGLIAGPISLPYLFYPSMSGFYTLPEWTPAYSSAFFIVAFVLIILCTAVSFIACYKLLRETPSETLRPRAPRIYRHNILERSGLWQKLGFNAQWNIRDTFRNRIRSIMAVIGVLGCTALIVCAFGMNNSMVDMKVWQYETIAQYESKLVLNEAATDKQIADVISAVNGEGIMESSVEIRANGEKKTGTLLVTDETTLLRQTDKRLNPASLPSDGVSVTQKMADMLGVMKGDAIEWHIYGAEDWHESKISEIYRDPINQGLTMTKQHFESLGAEFKMTSILSADTAGCYKTPSLRGASATKQSKDVAITGLLRSARNNVLLKLEFLHSLTVRENYAGVDSVEFTTDSISGWDDLTEALYTMIYLLIAAATVLSVVVLYNLGLLSFTEMERSMATLKVMGLKTRRLRNLLLTQNLWFSAVGFILGIPAGLWLIKIICSYSGESFDFPISLHTLTLAIAFVFTFGLSVLVNLMFSRKIRRLNMVESLKAME